nr:immunoglobulin light chain junction region [Macaca mulatta]
CASGHTSGRLF